MRNLSTIRVLFRAPDSLALWGIPYEMNRDVGQQPGDLYRAYGKRLGLDCGAAFPNWIFLGYPGSRGSMTEAEYAEVQAFLPADVPGNPYEWDTLPTRCQEREPGEPNGARCTRDAGHDGRCQPAE